MRGTNNPDDKEEDEEPEGPNSYFDDLEKQNDKDDQDQEEEVQEYFQDVETKGEQPHNYIGHGHHFHRMNTPDIEKMIVQEDEETLEEEESSDTYDYQFWGINHSITPDGKSINDLLSEYH